MKWLQRPKLIAGLVIVSVSVQLLISGSAHNLMSLFSTANSLEGQIQKLRAESAELQRKIRLTKDPEFIENQAADRLDLVEEHDLVFVFPKD